MKDSLARSLAVGLVISVVLGALHLWGVGLAILMALAIVMGLIAWSVPYYGVQLLDSAITWVRGHFWAPEQGRFHAFAGVPLVIEDDGRTVWVDAPGLQRALGRKEPEDVLAARHAGNWRRTDRGLLMLRVDAVVQVLARSPGRDDHRVQRLRRYFEREVLYPAAQRRQRS